MNNYKVCFAFLFFLVLGLLFFATTQKGYSAAVPSNLGCCGTLGDTCIVCETGDCALLEDECNDLGANFFFEGSVCSAEMVSCTDSFKETGCCVVSQGICRDDFSINSCDDTGGIGWYLSTSCTEVPDCAQAVRNVPTMSHWAAIALVGLLGIIGFIFIKRRYNTSI